jgi:F-type H+-transporting ATPase subunit b
MKRLALLALVFALAACVLPPARAQQTENQRAEQAARHPARSEGEEMTGWKWANFLVLAGVIGWLVKKHAGPYYAARSLQIKKDIIEAADFRQEAEARASAVERRLAGLEADIAALRSESALEAQTEGERLSRQTVAEIAKIEKHAEEQIAAAGNAARQELKRYSVELAIALARQKIATRITPETQDALVRGFVRHLETPALTRNS